MLYNSVMNTETLTYINLVLSIALLGAIAWLTIRHLRTDRVRREFFASGLKKDLEQILVDQNRSLTQAHREIVGLEERLANLYELNRRNVQKIGFVKFNPFDDAGGNISFALALLDAKDNGMIISSLHGRESMRVYAKTITAGKSDIKLTEEEERAITEAN